MTFYQKIAKQLDQSPSFQRFSELIRNANKTGIFTQLNFSLKSLLLAHAFTVSKKSVLLITLDDRIAEEFSDDLKLLLGSEQVACLPDYEVLAYEERSPHYVIRSERIKVLTDILSHEKKVITLSIRSLIQALTPSSILSEFILTVQQGQEMDMSDLIEMLVNSGYENDFKVIKPGQISKRGGIIDIFSPNYDMPVRLEFFGDEIYSIRHFNVESQRSEPEEINAIRIIPAREVILSKIAEDSPLKEKTALKGFYEGIEHDIPLLYQQKECLLNYFNKNEAILFWDNIHSLSQIAGEISKETEDMWIKAKKESKKRILPDPDTMFFNNKSLHQITADFSNHILTTAFYDPKQELFPLKKTEEIDFPTEPAPVIESNLILLEDFLDTYLNKQYTIYIQSENNAQKLRMQQLLPDLCHRLHFNIGVFHKGFILKDAKLAFLTDHEIFQRLKRKKLDSSFSKGEALVDYDSIKPGDYIVHIDYGIGIYEGLKTLDIDGKKIECLSIQYAQGDHIYVPTWQLGAVAKYISEEGSVPVIHKLGTRQWEIAKEKAKKQIELVVDEIVNLYAERSIRSGIRFDNDNEWQNEMEDSFIYEETPDQRKATEEIKRDMEGNQPMERLLCGDVGFGKTEVAIRAAFKAVMSGYQVAVLVPTTLLAEQHFSVFKERLAQFPVKIAMLSRFRTNAQKERDIVKLIQGDIDIMIGTHRLLSADIRYKKLGLLIIDEEHRFGVKHKDKIRQIKSSVDTLYMSATPIPRTLNMVLCNLKSISLIQTSPKARLPIRTVIVKYDKDVVREAIQRELDRGGQVYFLHNRVETINTIADDLMSILPNVRFRIGHGQLPEKELETVLMDFSDHKFDVLIATTIIESGIDIPNANTIIVNRADMFGLAQLYQIRGRVGRSNRRAYAYLMIPKNITPDARKRLDTLTEYESLGSGYQIAMRDLEIRGAGSLLGTKQSGTINTVGFNFYNRLLEQAIKNIQSKNPNGIWDEEERTDVRKIEIEADFYFPVQYITDEKEKISIYKRMLEFNDSKQFDTLKEELRDRFGTIPPLAARVIDYYRLRLFSNQIGLNSFQIKGNFILCEFNKNKLPAKSDLGKIIQGISYPVRFENTETLKLVIDITEANLDKEKKLAYAEKLIKMLKSIMLKTE
ncbi:MAG TPA: transcription-repair coupling factor [Candidatus Cloacimonadota bacterium]|nr:transcription-repair coupling factor [Candidatus Cloacimonadota bacterium]